jgi:hypothetical protein
MITPYKVAGVWVFDDPDVGLTQEPFVAGADLILDMMTHDIPDAEHGVNILFSDEPFPGAVHKFVKNDPEYGGYWYRKDGTEQYGWLCPAMFNYFDKSPDNIFIQVKEVEQCE